MKVGGSFFVVKVRCTLSYVPPHQILTLLASIAKIGIDYFVTRGYLGS
jgi:hypothetical protein